MNSEEQKEGEVLDVEGNKKQENEKIAAALSYVWILCLVPYFFNKDSDLVRFHSKQGVVLFLVETVLSVLFVFPMFGQVLFLFFLVVSALGASKAYNGERWKIPYIFELSKKIKL